MVNFPKNTKQAAKILHLRPNSLNQLVWNGDVPEPPRDPGNRFLWDDAAIDAASRALYGRPYRPQAVVRKVKPST